MVNARIDRKSHGQSAIPAFLAEFDRFSGFSADSVSTGKTQLESA